MGRTKQYGKSRRPRSDDPVWSAGQGAHDDYPDDEQSMYTLDNLVQSWSNKTTTVVLPDAVETQIEYDVPEEEEESDDETIPPPAPPLIPQMQEPKEKKGCDRKYLVGGTLMALVCIAAIVVVSVVAPGNSAPTMVSNSAQNGGGGTTTQTGSPPAGASREEAFRYFLADISSDEDLKTTGSPQSRALEWIVVYDSAKLDPTTANQREVQERYILAVFYYSLGGANWFDSFYFLSQNHVCNWKNSDFGMGVECDDASKTVKGFKFGKSSRETPKTCVAEASTNTSLSFLFTTGPNNLQGDLPPEIFLLEGLMSFQIIMNPGLTGSIPSTIDTLHNLEVLNLNKNSLTGEIPDSLLSLPSLETLWMDENSFEGSIPTINEDDTTLQWWSCNNCGLTGRMPDTLRVPNL